MANLQGIPKLYYSISQVSRMTQVEPHVLRYWETEFRELAPRKNRGGKRLYRESDVKVIMRIKQLLYQERFTVEGARRKLREELRGKNHGEDFQNGHPDAVIQTLREVRTGLLALKEALEN